MFWQNNHNSLNLGFALEGRSVRSLPPCARTAKNKRREGGKCNLWLADTYKGLGFTLKLQAATRPQAWAKAAGKAQGGNALTMKQRTDAEAKQYLISLHRAEESTVCKKSAGME